MTDNGLGSPDTTLILSQCHTFFFTHYCIPGCLLGNEEVRMARFILLSLLGVLTNSRSFYMSFYICHNMKNYNNISKNTCYWKHFLQKSKHAVSDFREKNKMTIRKQTSDFSFNLKQSTMFFSLPTKYFHTNANKSINPNGGLTVTALISDDSFSLK